MALPASPGTGATVAPTFGEAPGHTQTSSAEALELAKKLWAESAHPGRGADDARSAEADGSSGVQRSSSGRAASKRGLGLGLGVLAKVDEVPMWQRDAYLADLQTLSGEQRVPIM
jgi:ferric-dicitrate binding protein FerR (iron transport regulator)